MDEAICAARDGRCITRWGSQFVAAGEALIVQGEVPHIPGYWPVLGSVSLALSWALLREDWETLPLGTGAFFAYDQDQATGVTQAFGNNFSFPDISLAIQRFFRPLSFVTDPEERGSGTAPTYWDRYETDIPARKEGDSVPCRLAALVLYSENGDPLDPAADARALATIRYTYRYRRTCDVPGCV